MDEPPTEPEKPKPGNQSRLINTRKSVNKNKFSARYQLEKSQ